MLRLDLGVFRVGRRARFELVRRFLKRRVQRSPDFPAQAASCSCSSQRNPGRGRREGGRTGGEGRKEEKEGGGGGGLPCLALSSENSRATSSNLAPSRSFATASSFLACFSHCGSFHSSRLISVLPCPWLSTNLSPKSSPSPPRGEAAEKKRRELTRICLELIAVAGFNFPAALPSPSPSPPPPSFPFPFPFPFPPPVLFFSAPEDLLDPAIGISPPLQVRDIGAAFFHYYVRVVRCAKKICARPGGWGGSEVGSASTFSKTGFQGEFP